MTLAPHFSKKPISLEFETCEATAMMSVLLGFTVSIADGRKSRSYPRSFERARSFTAKNVLEAPAPQTT
jgi:hypothetical protein